MTVTTYSANAVARLLVAKGVKCDAKRVRAWARANIARLDDDGYTTHAYSVRERDAIVAALIKRARPDAKGTAGRASSASRGRAGTPKSAPKAKAKAKAAPKATPAATVTPESAS